MASPLSDALQQPLVAVENGQRVPQNPRLRLKKIVGDKTKNWKKKPRIRIGNWNIGSLTGKGREQVDVMQRRNIKVLCIQETKWKGNSARKIGEEYKVHYAGESTKKNGLGIIFHPDVQEQVTEVNDWLMTGNETNQRWKNVAYCICICTSAGLQR
ncbi:craniofacial development protein 2-like [Scylla paramamosain]|uniref:craniofacial development protein 2-like n=1 Tax=Scylla paramamosain TaxID=85552 RepID=UPI0030834318